MNSKGNNVHKQIFSIPLDGKQYLIYAPLKGIAFVANPKLVNEIFDHKQFACFNSSAAVKTINAEGSKRGTKESLMFLKELNFFQAEPLPVDEYGKDGVRYDSVVLFPTNRCSLRCTYCYASSGDHPVIEMPWEIAKAAIDHVARELKKRELPSMTIGFHGGREPTMNWELLTKATDYARSITEKNKIHLKVSGSFNGYWSEKVLKYVLNNFTDISLSFDGLPEIQNLHRPTKTMEGSFSRVVATLRALDRSNVNYGIRMTATKDSVYRMSDNVSFICENFKPRKIQVEPVFSKGRAMENKLKIEEIDVFIEQFARAYRMAAERGIVLFYSGARPESATLRFCLAACKALIVTPRGDVTTCFEIYSREHSLSDRFMVGCYRNGKFNIDSKKLNRHFKRTVEDIHFCENCFCKWHCAGD